MHPAVTHALAAACNTSNCNWQYATQTWTKGGAVLGLVILAAFILLCVAVAKRSKASKS